MLIKTTVGVTKPKLDVHSPVRTGRFGSVGKQPRSFYTTRKRVVMSGRSKSQKQTQNKDLCCVVIRSTSRQVRLFGPVLVKNIGRCV